MPTAKAKSWFVLADDVSQPKPKVVRRGMGETEARKLARDLNQRGLSVLYFAERLETSSVVDTENSQAKLMKDGWHGEVWDEGKRVFESSSAFAAKEMALTMAREWAEGPPTPLLEKLEVGHEPESK